MSIDQHRATRQQKVKARKLLNRALAAGCIERRCCEKCGAIRAQAHHENYSKPLIVHWLCARCHSQLHNQKYPTEKACEVCNKTFVPHPTKRKRAKTCSPECRAKAISRKLLTNPVVPPWAKLDHSAAEQIRAEYAVGGMTYRALARRHGVHHKQIGAIVRGEAWVRPTASARSVAQRSPK